MAQGLQIFNDDRIVQIDGSTPNLVLIAKGSARNSVTFNAPSRPIVFSRPVASSKFKTAHNGGSSYTFECEGNFDYWAFAHFLDPTTSSAGLQVFSESGALVYSSHSKPLRIHSFTSYTRIPHRFQRMDQRDDRSYRGRTLADYPNLLPHSNFAFAPNIGAQAWIERPSYYDYTYTLIFEEFVTLPRGFRIKEEDYGPGGVNDIAWMGPRDWSGPPGTILIADVSGM